MKRKNAILLLITIGLIIIGESLRHTTNNSMWSWIFAIAALGTAIFSATLKSSKLKRNNLVIMVVIALLFLLYPAFLNL